MSAVSFSIKKCRKKRLRILMVSFKFYPHVGGSERQGMLLLKYFLRRRCKVGVLTGQWSLHTSRREIIEDVEVMRHFTGWNMGNIWGLKLLSKYIYSLTLLYNLFRLRNDFDVFQAQQAHIPGFIVVLAGKLLGKRTFIRVSNASFNSDFLRLESQFIGGKKFVSYMVNHVDRIVSICKAGVIPLLERGYSESKIVFITNGIDLNHMTKKKTYMQQNKIVFVGRLSEEKGIDTLIDAFDLMKSKYRENNELLLVGGGRIQSKLEAQVTRLNLTQSIRFVGETDEPEKWLRDADIFVLPSRCEGLPNALIEAMGHGLPCIATDVGGTSEILQHEINGQLIQPDDPKALSAALIRLINNEELRMKLGKNARQYVCEYHNIEHIADKYIDLYRNCFKE